MEDMVHLDYRLVRQESDKAIQVWLHDWTLVWLPKSQMIYPYPKAGQRNGTLAIPEWLAKEKFCGEETETG